MNPEILREFMRLLTVLRIDDYRDISGQSIAYGRCLGYASALYEAGIITIGQRFQLDTLTLNAAEHAGKPFPSLLNAGPVMPASVLLERKAQSVKQSAQVPADEQQVFAPASRPGLRLLCLLVKTRTGQARSLPVHTMHPMPPRVLRPGRWSLAGDPSFVLRETHAARPSPEVLARYLPKRHLRPRRSLSVLDQVEA